MHNLFYSGQGQPGQGQSASSSIWDVSRNTAYAVDLLMSKNIASVFPSIFYYPWIALELSGHGVPWFVACFYLAFAYPSLQTVALNVLWGTDFFFFFLFKINAKFMSLLKLTNKLSKGVEFIIERSKSL